MRDAEPGDVQFDDESGEGGSLAHRARARSGSRSAGPGHHRRDRRRAAQARARHLRRVRDVWPEHPQGAPRSVAVRPAVHRVQDRRTIPSLAPRGNSTRSIAAIAPIGVAGAVRGPVDQITKTHRRARAARRAGRTSSSGPRLVLTYNSGAAFSVGSGRSGVFTVLALVVVIGPHRLRRVVAPRRGGAR